MRLSCSDRSVTIAGISVCPRARKASILPCPQTRLYATSPSGPVVRLTLMGCLRPTLSMLSTISANFLASRTRGLSTVMRSIGIVSSRNGIVGIGHSAISEIRARLAMAKKCSSVSNRKASSIKPFSSASRMRFVSSIEKRQEVVVEHRLVLVVHAKGDRQVGCEPRCRGGSSSAGNRPRCAGSGRRRWRP